MMQGDVVSGATDDGPSPSDHRWLAETLVLAAGARRDVYPDPSVGSIIVGPDGDVVGRGHHARLGGSHAEPAALVDAGVRAVGSTLFCNLEPCGYEAPEKRQPACTDAIIRAGISRVVVGQVDPHPRVRGAGIERLVTAGIDVDIAPDPEEAWSANPVYNTVLWLGRPFVHVVSPTFDEATGGSWMGPEHETPTDALAMLPESVRSIRISSPGPATIDLPQGWHVDAIDGRLQAAWMAALHEAASTR